MKVSKKLLIATCATIGACFLGANTYAESIAIKIDDSTLYGALKTCVADGMTKEEFNQLPLYSRQHVETLSCFDFGSAVFDDSTQTITFADEESLDKVEYVSLPNMGLTDISDLTKFPNLKRGSFYKNHLKSADFGTDIVSRMHSSIVAIAADNNLEDIPYYYDFLNESGHVYGDPAAVKEILLVVLSMPNQNIEDSYSGDSYELPPIASKFYDALTEYQDICQTEDCIAGWDHALADINNILYLENAALSDDGMTLSPIDSSKDMLMKYRFPYSMFEHDDWSTDWGTLEYLAGDGEYINIITIRVKSNNNDTPNPNTLDDFNMETAIISFALMSLGSALAIKYGTGRNK